MKRVLLGSALLLSSATGFALVVEAGARDQSSDVVARVGDQNITFSQINTMLNSSPVVGLSVPALGTPERDQVRLTLLDKIISANLIYLEALQKGVDRNPDYQRDLRRFSEGMLASLYREKVLVGEVEVTDDEIRTFFGTHIPPGTELTDALKTSIAAKLRKQRRADRTASLREGLRKGKDVAIIVTELDPEEDVVRDATDIVATVDGEAITWEEAQAHLSRAANALSVERRIEALEAMIDDRIMAAKGRAAGLDKDPLYQQRLNEFKKVRLINRHRASIIEQLQPSDQEIRDYYTEHKDQIVVKERRKVQIVVLRTEAEAQAVKEMIESGTITMYQAAAQHSILPGADETLGDLGWVNNGTGFTELDKLTFSLEPGAIGGPVESPNGWHLVKVQDVEDAVHDDIEDRQTWRLSHRRLIKERLSEYVVNLRRNLFPVNVYDDRLSYLMQKEVDWYTIKAEKGARPPGQIYEEIEKLRK